MTDPKKDEFEKIIRNARPTSGIFHFPAIKKGDSEIDFARLTAVELKEQINELLKSFKLEKIWTNLVKLHIIKNWTQKKNEGSITYLKRIYPRIKNIAKSIEILKNKEGGKLSLIMMAKDKETSIKEKINKLEDGDIEDIISSYGPF